MWSLLEIWIYVDFVKTLDFYVEFVKKMDFFSLSGTVLRVGPPGFPPGFSLSLWDLSLRSSRSQRGKVSPRLLHSGTSRHFPGIYISLSPGPRGVSQAFTSLSLGPRGVSEAFTPCMSPGEVLVGYRTGLPNFGSPGGVSQERKGETDGICVGVPNLGRCSRGRTPGF